MRNERRRDVPSIRILASLLCLFAYACLSDSAQFEDVTSLIPDEAEYALALSREHYSSLEDGVKLMESGSDRAAAQLFNKGFQETQHPAFPYHLGMIFLQNGDFRRGLPTLDASITYMSNLPASAHSFLAGPDAGVMQLPAFSQILYNAGMARQQMGRPDLALPLFVRAIELDSTFRPAFVQAAWNARMMGDLITAANYLHTAVELDPTDVPIITAFADLLNNLKHWVWAEKEYHRALALSPSSPSLHNNLGSVLSNMGRYSESRKAFKAAMDLLSDIREGREGRNKPILDDPLLLPDYDHHPHTTTSSPPPPSSSSSPSPSSPSPFSASSPSSPTSISASMRAYASSLPSVGDVAKADLPHIEMEVEATMGMITAGTHLASWERVEKMEAHLHRLISFQLRAFYLLGPHLANPPSLSPYLSLFVDFSPILRKQLAEVRYFKSTFELSKGGAKERLQQHAPLKSVEEVVEERGEKREEMEGDDMAGGMAEAKRSAKSDGGVMRVGFISRRFEKYAGTRLLLGVFRQHRRDRVKLFCFAHGPDDGSEERKKVMEYCDHFEDVSALPAEKVTATIRSHHLHVLFDYDGGHDFNNGDVLNLKAAPTQVTWLGFPGTSGMLDAVDHIVTDRVITPPEYAREYMTESVVYLPSTYQPHDDEQQISGRAFTKSDMFGRSDVFVLACFNRVEKIDVIAYSAWMEVLKEVPTSVLWLYVGGGEGGEGAGVNKDGMAQTGQDSEEGTDGQSDKDSEDSDEAKKEREERKRKKAADRSMLIQALRHRAIERGVDPSRIFFADKMSNPDHLARHQLVDLFLDTRIYNAHTTASDALYTGVPVVTVPGESFSARVAASLVAHEFLPHFCSPSPPPSTSLSSEDGRGEEKKKGKVCDLLRDKLVVRRYSDLPTVVKHIANEQDVLAYAKEVMRGVRERKEFMNSSAFGAKVERMARVITEARYDKKTEAYHVIVV